MVRGSLSRSRKRLRARFPWADRGANPHLIDFWKREPRQTTGKLALTVGSGLGDDAEQLAAWGFQTTAFDISETAIRAAKKSFPHTAVQYLAGDVLHPPPDWNGKFDFVFEANTLQALPRSIRQEAMKNVAQFVRPGGLLLVVARGQDEADGEGTMPWPLTRTELEQFTRAGLIEESFEDFLDSEDPPTRRFRVLYRR